MEQSTTGEFASRANLTPASMVVQKPKKDNSLKIAVIVLAVISLGLGGFLAYDKLIVGDPKCNTAGSSLAAGSTIAEGKGYVRSWTFGSFYVSAEGSVFFTTDSINAVEASFEIDLTDFPGDKGVFDRTEALFPEYKSNLDDNVIDGYKLNTSKPIVAVGDMGWGAELASYDFSLIANDGTISLLSIALDGKVSLVEDVVGYENVAYTERTLDDDGFTTTVFYRDGSHAEALEADFKEVE